MAKTKTKFTYNRVLKLLDYDALGVETRKGWEIALALKTLRELGATGFDAKILGVGAGRESTIFHLANGEDALMVYATDIYNEPDVWAGWHGPDFLEWPARFSPAGVHFETSRIHARHADMRNLPFEDGMFDGVFSSGSIEHVGQAGIADYDAISQAAREIGRVTMLGGIISLSTEWKISGDGWGWSHVRLFDADTIMRVIVAPSGCELVDEPDWSYDGDVTDALNLTEAIRDPSQQIMRGLISDHGFVFTSVHLALRKPA